MLSAQPTLVNAPFYNKKHHLELEKARGQVIISTFGINFICAECHFSLWTLQADNRRTACYTQNWNSCTQEMIFLWKLSSSHFL